MAQCWHTKEIVAVNRDGWEWTFVNVYPSTLPAHTLNPDCWCEPEWREEVGFRPRVALLLHKEVH